MCVCACVCVHQQEAAFRGVKLLNIPVFIHSCLMSIFGLVNKCYDTSLCVPSPLLFPVSPLGNMSSLSGAWHI